MSEKGYLENVWILPSMEDADYADREISQEPNSNRKVFVSVDKTFFILTSRANFLSQLLPAQLTEQIDDDTLVSSHEVVRWANSKPLEHSKIYN